MSGMPDIICAACGGDLTVVRDFWDTKSILLPLLSVEVLPCSNCLTRAACEGLSEVDRLYGEEYNDSQGRADIAFAEYLKGLQKIADTETSRPEGE
jgi:hypothetical protein